MDGNCDIPSVTCENGCNRDYDSQGCAKDCNQDRLCVCPDGYSSTVMLLEITQNHAIETATEIVFHVEMD